MTNSSCARRAWSAPTTCACCWLPLAGGEPVAAIAWRAAALREQLGSRLRVAYRPQVNAWRGERQLQLLVEGLAPV